MNLVSLACLVLVWVHGGAGITTKSTDEFLLQFEEKFLSAVQTELVKENITLVKRILPGTYMFRDDGTTSGIPEVLKQNPQLKDQVSAFDRVLEYGVELWTKMPEKSATNLTIDTDETSKVSTYFDMGVEGAWQQNYTGRGVVIGVTDVGVDTHLEDLKPNIDVDSSYNAVDDSRSSDVTPEEFDDYEKTLAITDHGNRCVGMIAAVRNDKCGEGVAYGAKIAVLRIFNASFIPGDLDYPHGQLHFRFARMAEGINHAIPTVDIYSNSWGTVEDFEKKDAYVAAAIANSINHGRDGKGAIHVFPVGSLADPYANSIYTIAVNSLGQGGRLTTFSSACACTLTTAYGKGCDKFTGCDTSHMLTTSRVRGCTLEFEGTSASTAIGSGITALALQANPALGWREVQHIVVESSGRNTDMAEYDNFLQNGAGRMYHPVLGFGLLNATKLVSLAKAMQPLPQQLYMTATSSSLRQTGHASEANLTLTCTNDLCIKSVEHVVLTIDFTAPRIYHCRVTLVSPLGTESLIMDKEQSNGTSSTTHDNVEFLSVNFWGEPLDGTWKLYLENHLEAAETFSITNVKLMVYGTGTGANNYQPSTKGPGEQSTATKADDSTEQGTKATSIADAGSATGVVMYFVLLVGFSGVIFALGFREMLKHKSRSQYAAIKFEDSENAAITF